MEENRYEAMVFGAIRRAKNLNMERKEELLALLLECASRTSMRQRTARVRAETLMLAMDDLSVCRYGGMPDAAKKLRYITNTLLWSSMTPQERRKARSLFVEAFGIEMR